MINKRTLSQLIENTAKSVLLLGPRQTGKSTLIQSLGPDLEINLANEEEYLRFSTQPSALIDLLKVNPARSIFIDEVQRTPNLLNVVQVIIDQDKRAKRDRRFLITGSSARKLRRENANLMPGRVFAYELGPLTARELDYGIDQQRALEFGTLPEPYLEGDREFKQKLLRSYTGTYLREEIQTEANLRSLQGYARFLQTLAQFAGQYIDHTKLAKASKVSRNTIPRYFELLEDTLIARRVYAFEGVQDADLIKHPRVYFFDNGVLNGLLQNFAASLDRKGLLFEHLLFNQIHASACALDREAKISNFRTRGGLEVDFVVQLNERTWMIEAKATDAVDAGDVSPLLEAHRYYPSATPVIAYLGERELEIKGVRVYPWQQLLAAMGL